MLIGVFQMDIDGGVRILYTQLITGAARCPPRASLQLRVNVHMWAARLSLPDNERLASWQVWCIIWWQALCHVII